MEENLKDMEESEKARPLEELQQAAKETNPNASDDTRFITESEFNVLKASYMHSHIVGNPGEVLRFRTQFEGLLGDMLVFAVEKGMLTKGVELFYRETDETRIAINEIMQNGKLEDPKRKNVVKIYSR